MMEAHDHIEKARELLAEGRHLLAGRFPNGAGRSAYMAAFHAAHAYVVAKGSSAKRHKGVQIEFHRLAHESGEISQTFTAFLSTAYDLKATADYDDDEPPTLDEAAHSLAMAEQMIKAIAELLPKD